MKQSDMALLAHLTDVPRWNGVQTIQNQNVAEHCFHVAWLALLFAEASGDVGYHEVVWWALFHDKTESITGDPPSPFKQHAKSSYDEFDESLEVDPLIAEYPVYITVKLADLMEALIFEYRETQLGNRNMHAIRVELTSRFMKTWREFEWGRPGPKPDPYRVINAIIHYATGPSVFIGTSHPYVEESFWSTFDPEDSEEEAPF